MRHWPRYMYRDINVCAKEQSTTAHDIGQMFCVGTFRIEPGLKEALRAAAEQEHRSIANMVALTIRDYCGRNNVTIQEQRQLPAEGKRKPHTGKR